MSATHRVLVVDDEPSILRYTRTLLELQKIEVDTASSGAEAVARLQNGGSPDLILLDYAMPGMNGIQVLEQVRKIRPAQKVVMMSCVTETGTVVQAMKLGALDYLPKPFYRSHLDALISRCVPAPSADAFISPEKRVDEPAAPVIDELDDDLFFLSASKAMNQIRHQVSLIAKVDVPVLILGESGVGKEVLARYIHKCSNRAHRDFLKVNCAALPADLLESELFGYESGAFTGAVKAKPGKFEVCNRGTMLMDEIGEMPNVLQAKLLHVLQDGEFSRLGGRNNIKVDVRILAATNINIDQGIADRTFREDLYYRLNSFTLKVPPLRDRREEIPLLLKNFLTKLADQWGTELKPYSARFLDACMKYHWPGNIRQLANVAKRYLVIQDEELIIQEFENTTDFRDAELGIGPKSASGLKGLVRDIKDQAELKAIERALVENRWNRKAAAAELKISYKALLYKMKQYQITPPCPPASLGPGRIAAQSKVNLA